jgi:hypothetical protein
MVYSGHILCRNNLVHEESQDKLKEMALTFTGFNFISFPGIARSGIHDSRPPSCMFTTV